MDSRKGSASCTTQLVKERNQSSNKVKLCGYLKKKRNKVGGWRKMWFVLQDKLLLSYTSKEEYDNKLVSFKDVLNLVPGTLVRPLGGFRFTIETTSHAMYTFHCDDRNAYREWIAVLLDSLAGGQSRKPATSFVQRFHNISADNIPQALCFNAALHMRQSREISNSCDSIRQRVTDSANYEWCQYENQCERIGEHMERAAMPSPSSPLALSCVRLPIARSTAKILERNGVNSSGLPLPQQMATAATQQQRPPTGACNRNNRSPSAVIRSHIGGNHFRLHRSCSNDNNDSIHSAAELHQSSVGLTHPVTMINRMFQQAIANDDGRVQPDKKRKQAEATRNNCDQSEYETYSNGRVRNLEKWSLDYENSSPRETCSCSSDDCKALDMVRDRIERMSIKGFRESATDSTTDAVEQCERSKVMTTRGVEEIVMARASRNPLGIDCSGPNQTDFVDTSTQPEPIYAVVDLQHKYAQRKLRNNCTELKRCNSYDSIIQSSVGGGAAAARMKRSEKSASSAIADDIDGIYEDGDTFFTNTSNLNGSPASAEEENIYEPINVPTTTQPNAFWKYFTRLKVNSLLHLTRLRKRESATYETIKLPALSSAASRATEVAATAAESASPQSAAALQFSSIKHKFGTHRKSMQVRVRRLCARAYEPKPFFRHHKPHHLQQSQQQPQSAQSNGSLCGSGIAAGAAVNSHSHCNNNNNKKCKYRWKSVKIRPKYLCSHNGLDDSARGEKQRFFGSLPHLRKARTSIFASSHLQLANGDGRAPATNNSSLSTNST